MPLVLCNAFSPSRCKEIVGKCTLMSKCKTPNISAKARLLSSQIWREGGGKRLSGEILEENVCLYCTRFSPSRCIEIVGKCILMSKCEMPNAKPAFITNLERRRRERLSGEILEENAVLLVKSGHLQKINKK